MGIGQITLGRSVVITGLIGLTLGSVRYLLTPQGGPIGSLLLPVTVGLWGLACTRRTGRRFCFGFLLGLGAYVLFETAAEVHPRSAAGAVMSWQTQVIYSLLDRYLPDWAVDYVEANGSAYGAAFLGLPLLCWGVAVGGIVAVCTRRDRRGGAGEEPRQAVAERLI